MMEDSQPYARLPASGAYGANHEVTIETSASMEATACWTKGRIFVELQALQRAAEQHAADIVKERDRVWPVAAEEQATLIVNNLVEMAGKLQQAEQIAGTEELTKEQIAGELTELKLAATHALQVGSLFMTYLRDRTELYMQFCDKMHELHCQDIPDVWP